jgi:hypothetical protein
VSLVTVLDPIGTRSPKDRRCLARPTAICRQGRFGIAADRQQFIINGLAVGVAFESRAAERGHIPDLRRGDGLRLH